jgi:hypothetical protein
MRKFLALTITGLLLGMLAASLAFGAEIDAPATIGPNKLVMVSTPTEGTGFSWWVVGPRGVEQVVDTVPDGHAIVFTGPEGQYTVMLSVFSAEGVEKGQAVVSIQEGDLPPGPTPTPAPDKITAMYWLHETAEPSVDSTISAVRDSPVWRDAADAAGIKWKCLDDDVAEADEVDDEPLMPAIVEAARRTGLPQIAFVDVNKKIYLERPPATIDGVVGLIRHYGGKTNASK